MAAYSTHATVVVILLCCLATSTKAQVFYYNQFSNGNAESNSICGLIKAGDTTTSTPLPFNTCTNGMYLTNRTSQDNGAYWLYTSCNSNCSACAPVPASVQLATCYPVYNNPETPTIAQSVQLHVSNCAQVVPLVPTAELVLTIYESTTSNTCVQGLSNAISTNMGASTSCQPIFPSLFATVSTGLANDIIVNICTDNACSVNCNTIQTTISGCAPLPGVVNRTLSVTPLSYVNACKVPDQHLNKSSIAAIVVGSIAGLALLIGVVVYACKARRSGYAAISDY